MIGMYKKINRVIEKEKEKGEFLLKLGIRLFLATDNEFYVNKTYAETSRTIASPILLEAQTKTP
ncbi:hypothetical protein EXW45_05135 [Bacillus wiedmannii]|uniref:hypothetical protein n=1 Tax=Bacillus cereus group TaxID=86661 RepID=UPI0011ECED73|nr:MULTISPECIES: hypothetical protein [Bacillus cereus group]KAA0785453.1 hypothetical protein DN394_21180 [Bacillus sp. BB081]QWH70793.1 hypothetical protein EXW45_05135 [Bacillus wiedmannii]